MALLALLVPELHTTVRPAGVLSHPRLSLVTHLSSGRLLDAGPSPGCWWVVPEE